MDERVEPLERGDAAADDDPLGGERVDDVPQAAREVPGGEGARLLPRGRGELLEARAEPLGQGRTGGHPLEAVAVEGAAAGVVVAGLARHREMPDLGVDEPVRRMPAHDGTAPDPRPDGQVDERVETGRRAEASLRDRGAVDVGVDRDRPASSRPRAPATSTPDQPSFGVSRRRPKRGDPGRSSTGPNVAAPTASSGP